MSLWLGLASASSGQSVVDRWAWVNAGTHLDIDSSAWTVDAAYMYIRNQLATRFFVQAGSLSITRKLGKQGWAVGVNYAFGQQAELGLLHLGQWQLQYNRPQGRLRPNARLTLDRLWVPTPPPELITAPSLNRVRLLIGLQPALSPVWTLLANTEPFLLRNRDWFGEVRSQFGLRWQKMRQLKIELAYFNRWDGSTTATVHWQHAGVLSANVGLRK